jgi:hypothetical protein
MSYIEYNTYVHRICVGMRCVNGPLPWVLVLAVALLVSCSHKDQSALNPSPSPNIPPVVQPSPNTSEIGTHEPRRIELFRTGEAMLAGYLGYKVFGSWFTTYLPQANGTPPLTGTYLTVDLAIANTDKKEREAAPLAVIDETGKEYTLCEEAAVVEGSVAKIGKLMPNASQRTFAIFAVPKGHQYRLKIQGFSDADAVLIELSPAATVPAK